MHGKAAYRHVLSGVVSQIKVSHCHLCYYVRRHADVRRKESPNLLPVSPMHIFLEEGGSACEAVADFNRSLRSCYFDCVVNERASFASFVKVPGDSSDFSVLPTKKSLMFYFKQSF